MASYLARYDGRVSVNLCALVGNSALRIDALGWDDVPADEAALDRIRGLLREAMEDGAFGLSSGLDYPPGCYATTAELAALTGEAARGLDAFRVSANPTSYIIDLDRTLLGVCREAAADGCSRPGAPAERRTPR